MTLISVGASDSIPGLVTRNLWCMNWHWAGPSQSTSLSPANYHSTLTYHQGQHNLRPQVYGKHITPHLPQKPPASGWMSNVKSDSVKINTFVRHNPDICDFLWLLQEEAECWIYKITHSVSEFARLLLWRAADWLDSLPMCKVNVVMK